MRVRAGAAAAAGDPGRSSTRSPHASAWRFLIARSYCAPLAGLPGIDFRLQGETLYNSIFAYDDEMLINQHVYGMYGYMAPVLHPHRMDGGDSFDMYVRSFDSVREISPPIQEPAFWQQRASALSTKPAKAAR